jgi:CheY-like chemotaxis protein
MVPFDPVEDINLWPDELKILVVDDEQDSLHLMRFSLERAGFQVLRTSEPEASVNLAHQEKPDLLILGVKSPRFGSLELLRRIRRHPRLADIPAILVSASSNSPDQAHLLNLSLAQNSEIDAYIGKPFDPTLFLKTVKNVLVKNKDFLVMKGDNAEDWERPGAYH